MKKWDNHINIKNSKMEQKEHSNRYEFLCFRFCSKLHLSHFRHNSTYLLFPKGADINVHLFALQFKSITQSIIPAGIISLHGISGNHLMY